MKKISAYLLMTMLLVLPLAAWGQPSFTLKAPSRVSAGSKFAVTFSLKNGDGTSLKVPQINGCTLLYGPSTSQSSSYSIINGQASSSTTFDYTYYYRADQEGTYTIGEASIVVDGKTLTTKPATLTVVAAPAGAQGGGSSSGGYGATPPPVNVDDISTQSSDRKVGSDDVFVRIILSKSSAYEQEAIECTIKLYTKYSISSFFSTKQPSFDGFLIQEVDVQPQLNQYEKYKGQEYMTALLKKCILFPQRAGKLTINSGNYDLKVVQYDNVNMGFFNVRTPQERSIQVSSNSASINITPLPTPQPEGFTGAVGDFKIDSRLVGNNFRTNDPATLIYTIQGTGNIKYVKEPVIDFPSEFELYTPKSDINANVAGSNVTGTMTIEYTFVPQSVGDFKIGSDKFVYFNPSSKRYVTLSTPTYDIKVAKGLSSASTDVDKQDIATKNTDILHIKLGEKQLLEGHTLVISTWWYWMLYAILIIALVAIVLLYSRQARLAADVRGQRLAKAGKVAQKRLKLARQYMTAGDSDKFYAELLRAMWGYLSDKLSMPASQLSRDNISAQLTAYGASEATVSDILGVLDDCEMARYSPAQNSEAMNQIFDRASRAINSLESTKRSRSMKSSLPMLLAIVMSAASLTSWAGALDERADSAYTADQFKEALDLYNQALTEDGSSSTLYYNIGNCYYRLGKPGMAIVSYERALRLDPTNQDAKTNLAFVNSRIIDRQGERGSFMSNAYDSIALAAHSNTWAWLAFGLFALGMISIAVYIFMSSIMMRKVGFFGAIILLLGSMVCITISARASTLALRDDVAIITAPSTILSTSPRTPKDRNEEAMLLHEGTKVEILDSVTTTVDSVSTRWYDVQVDNAHRAWIRASEVEKI